MTQAIPLSKLYGWKPKCVIVEQDITEGRLSYSRGKPIVVSRLDSPKGGFMIIDGYHRAIEDLRAGKNSIVGEISTDIPRIERVGGAYNCYVNDKVCIAGLK